MTDILEALAYIHSQSELKSPSDPYAYSFSFLLRLGETDIIHCDLKLENFLMHDFEDDNIPIVSAFAFGGNLTMLPPDKDLRFRTRT